MAYFDERERRTFTEDELHNVQLPPDYDAIRYVDGFHTFQLTDVEEGKEYKKMIDDIIESADNPIVEVELKKLEEKVRVAFFRYDVLSTYDSYPLRHVYPEEWEGVKEQFEEDYIRAFVELDEICTEIENIYKGILPKWADPSLKHDREEVLQAVSKNEQALRFASPELKEDKQFIMEIISEHGNALHYVPTKDPELLWHASKHGYHPNAEEKRLIQKYNEARKKDLVPFLKATDNSLSGLNKHGHHYKQNLTKLIASFSGHPPKGGTKRKRKNKTKRR